MRQLTLFARSVVNLLGLNFRCQVEETPSSFNYTHCLVTSLLGKELAVPVGFFIAQEHFSKPVHLQWFLRNKGSFERGCVVVYVFLAQRLNTSQSAAAMYRMLVNESRAFMPQDFKVLRVSGNGRGDFVNPEEFLVGLEAERFKRSHDRRNGHVVIGSQGQILVKSGASHFDISLPSFPGTQYMRKIDRLRVGDKVSFRPMAESGLLVAGEIRWHKPIPKPSHHRKCA
jgi:hypothetical protein